MLDVVLLVATLISVALGAWRGLIYEVLSIIGWIAAFVLAPIYGQAVGNGAFPAAWQDGWRLIGGYLLTFIGVVFAAGLIAWIAKKLLSSVGLRPADRAFGALFGLLRAGVLALGLLIVARLAGFDQSAWWQQSKSGPILSSAVPALKAVLPDAVAGRL